MGQFRIVSQPLEHFVYKIHFKDPMVSSALFAMALYKGLQLKKIYLYLFQNYAFSQETLGHKICAARKF
jgi:hypothetical protein